MTLFELPPAAEPGLDGQPLAARMRPRSLEDLVGQEAVLGPGQPLRKLIEADRAPSLILWGPPGCGKSTLAVLIAAASDAHYAPCSAVLSGVADLRKLIERARVRREAGGRTILFIDEIHRFNKSQQDALLPSVEDGTVTLIGATTENPHFEVNAPLLSRCRLVRLEALSEDDLRRILRRALDDAALGLASLGVDLTPDAESHILRSASGDARFALNALEAAALAASPDAHGRRQLDLELVEQALQKRAFAYDRDGDHHYDVVSAWIKSIRGSDPDAAVYWLHRMLIAGEDPRFLCRRLLIHAAEDIGMADPAALSVAMAAAYALDHVGLPEAAIPMTQATLYLAMAPKSNSVVKAISRARAELEANGPAQVPQHLRDSHYAGADGLGHGRGYLYPHDYPGGYVKQDYLPPGALSAPIYEPGRNGFEEGIAAAMAERKASSDQEKER